MANNYNALITTTSAPSLPTPPTQYNQSTQELLNNALRLYFNQLDSANAKTIQAVNDLNTAMWMELNTGIW